MFFVAIAAAARRHRRPSRYRHQPKAEACAGDCPACALPHRPKLYSVLHVDGVGTTVKYIAEHARFAREQNYAYGGAIGTLPLTPQAHGVVQRQCVAWALGTDAVVVREPAGISKAKSISDLASNQTVLWTEKHVPLAPKVDKAWLADMRRGNACRLGRARLTYARKGTVRVAAHLRRGDVDVSVQPSLRWVSDACLVDALGWVAARAGPRAEVHVFSALESHRGRGGATRCAKIKVSRRLWCARLTGRFLTQVMRGTASPEAFDVYRAHNYTVHLNGADATASVLDHWAHLASADVFLQSPTSAFAVVPAYLSRGCVLRARVIKKGLHCYALDAADEKCVRRAVERRLREIS